MRYSITRDTTRHNNKKYTKAEREQKERERAEASKLTFRPKITHLAKSMRGASVLPAWERLNRAGMGEYRESEKLRIVRGLGGAT